MNKLLIGAALALSTSTVAIAAPALGTFGAAVFTGTFSGTLDVGSTITTTAGITTTGGTGDLASLSAGTLLTGITTPFTVQDGSAFTFTTSGGAVSFTTGALGLFNTSLDNAAINNRVVSFQALGTFTTTLGGFDGGPASITGSLTQTGGPDSAVSYSFTFSSPPAVTPPPVPAPAAIGFLGLGVLALGLRRR